MTGYVATRWYRAPEIMLNWMHYNKTGKPHSSSALFILANLISFIQYFGDIVCFFIFQLGDNSHILSKAISNAAGPKLVMETHCTTSAVAKTKLMYGQIFTLCKNFWEKFQMFYNFSFLTYEFVCSVLSTSYELIFFKD